MQSGMKYYSAAKIYLAASCLIALVVASALTYYVLAGGVTGPDPASVEARAFPISTPGKPSPSKTPMKDQEKDDKMQPLAADVWGGTGIIMTVGDKTVQIQYDCGSGEIAGKVMVGRNGEFTAIGVHIRQRPGPSREDQPDERLPANYTGTVKGDGIAMKVTLTSDNSIVGEYNLERGKAVRLRRCL
jgi:hypothetical protein